MNLIHNPRKWYPDRLCPAPPSECRLLEYALHVLRRLHSIGSTGPETIWVPFSGDVYFVYAIVLGAMLLGSACSKKDKVVTPTDAASFVDAGDAGEASMRPENGIQLKDCTRSEYADDPACKSPSSLLLGSIGTGTPFYISGQFSSGIVGGFLEGGTLILAVEYGTTSGDDPYGAIVSVDLKTGNRTLISGAVNDTLSKGVGEALNDMRDVKPVDDQKLLAFVRGKLIEIDRSTGDRTLRWNDPRDGEEACPVTRSGSNAPAIYLGSLTSSVAVVSLDEVYFPINNSPPGSGTGLARLNLTTRRCEIVSLSNADNASFNRGSGPGAGGSFDDIVFAENTLWLLSAGRQDLIQVDRTSGDRIRISSSSADHPLGDGPSLGSYALSVSDSAAWTMGLFGRSDAYVVRVEKNTGNRVEVPLGDTLRSAVSETPSLWYSEQHHLLWVAHDNAIHALDPVTGNSNVISY